MCSDLCASRRIRHTEEECGILSRCPNEERPEKLRVRKDEKTYASAIIAPLRMLLLQKSQSDEWRRSDQLMDHKEGK